MTSTIPEMNAFRLEHPHALDGHPTLAHLRHVVLHFPLIDHHARSLLLPKHLDSVPFESLTTEARGRALRDTFKALPHLRAARQLRRLYECPEDADWEDVLEQRIEWLKSDPDRLNERCFAGVHAVLVDDGGDSTTSAGATSKMFPHHFLDRYTKAPGRRIVKIESLAEDIMRDLLEGAADRDLKHVSFLTDTWARFTETFERGIQDASRDPSVAAFKTVICCRSGLDVEPDYEVAAKNVGLPFERYVERCVRKRRFAVEKKALNDYLVLRTLEILSERVDDDDDDADQGNSAPASASASRLSKPLLLHTGLGDNDIGLLEANPAYLQPLIENYSSVPFVLLHAAYPYTREAGYLATVYKHVYLDLGEVFPMVSRNGQGQVLRQALELVPGSKLLYSSGGRAFPEAFWLANGQFREAWLELLAEYVLKGDLTAHQAIAITKDVLFNNANVLYGLQYTPDVDELPESQASLPLHRPASPATPSPSGTPVPKETGRSLPSALPLAQQQQQLQSTQAPDGRSIQTTFPPPPTQPIVYNVPLFEQFMAANDDLKFVMVGWLDYASKLRSVILPVATFARLVHSSGRVAISQGDTGSPRIDEPTGPIFAEPDLTSMRRTPDGSTLHAVNVFSFWRDEDGRPLPECPRANLERLVAELQYQHGATMLVEFDVQFTLLTHQPPRHLPTPTSDRHGYENDSEEEQSKSWQPPTPFQSLSMLPLVATLVTDLQSIGIQVQHFRSGNHPGEYKFTLPPAPPLVAVDVLLQARLLVTHRAAAREWRASFEEMPLGREGWRQRAGVTLSLEPPDRERDERFFVEGVLGRFAAVSAFTMGVDGGYGPSGRGATSTSASTSRAATETHRHGSEDEDADWITWGTNNAFTPLTMIPSASKSAHAVQPQPQPQPQPLSQIQTPGHGTAPPLSSGVPATPDLPHSRPSSSSEPAKWRLTTVSPNHNPYLSLSAILAAGLLGLESASASASASASSAPASSSAFTPASSATLAGVPPASFGNTSVSGPGSGPGSALGSEIRPGHAREASYHAQVQPHAMHGTRGPLQDLHLRNPSRLSAEERAHFGVVQRMPRSVGEAVRLLRGRRRYGGQSERHAGLNRREGTEGDGDEIDEAFVEKMGADVVGRWIEVVEGVDGERQV